MSLIDTFNEVVERELAKMPKDLESAMESSMAQFDALVRHGIIQPERYKIEPISTLSVCCAPARAY